MCVGRTCRADIPRVMLVVEPNPSRRAASVSVDSSSRPEPRDTSLPLVPRQCPLLPASPAKRLRRWGGCACVAAPDSKSAPDKGSIPAPSPCSPGCSFCQSLTFRFLFNSGKSQQAPPWLASLLSPSTPLAFLTLSNAVLSYLPFSPPATLSSLTCLPQRGRGEAHCST